MQALLLDLDDTLLDDCHATRVALSAFLMAHRAALAGESADQSLARWRNLFSIHWRKFERGEMSFDDQRRARVREFLRCDLTDAEADNAFKPYRSAYEASWSLVQGCAEFLEWTADIPKVILTNGDRDQQLRKIRLSGIGSHIIATITPADCGHWKPAQGMFLAAMALLGVKASACLMIGDDPVRDIRPASQLGMRTCLVDSADPQRSLLHAIVEVGRPCRRA